MSAMNGGLPANVNRQLFKLVRDEGLTIEQACASMDLDIEAGQMAMMSFGKAKNQEVTLTQLVERYRPEAVEVIVEIMRTGERDADRLKAAQILFEGKGLMPEVNAAAASKILNMFAQMEQNLNPIIDAVEIKTLKAS